VTVTIVRANRSFFPGAAPFTLVEIVIVVVIISLVLALVLPRVGYLPEGVRARVTLSAAAAAFSNAALRARAKSQRVELVLDTETHQFRISEVPVNSPFLAAEPDSTLSETGEPPGAQGPRHALFRDVYNYDVPERGIEWQIDDEPLVEPVVTVATFMSNGEGAAKPLQVRIGPARIYRLNLDRLTGHLRIEEVETDG